MSKSNDYRFLIELFLKLRGGKSIIEEGVRPFFFFGKDWIVHLRNNKDSEFEEAQEGGMVNAMSNYDKNRKDIEIDYLLGKIIKKITIKENEDGDELHLETENEIVVMLHDQDCCEEVYIEDICGEIGNLKDSPIIVAEKRTLSHEDDDKWDRVNDWDKSYTWTFYELATIKGAVTIRWYGASNGYYSERVSIIKVPKKDSDERLD